MAPDRNEDQELIEAARAGDRAALERLLARQEGRVFRFAMKMCREPEDAKDILQETLLAMAKGIGEFRGDASLSTWLFTVARSFCVKKHRRAALETVPLDESIAERVPEPSAAADHRVENEQALDDAIASLDPMYREVLVLRDMEGMTAPEVASVLGIGVDAVKSRLHRARVAVRARLAASEPPPRPTCPDIVDLLSRHLEDEISPDACTVMEKHVEGCEACRGRCDSLRKTLALCRSTPGIEVPEKIQQSVRRAVRDVLARRNPT